MESQAALLGMPYVSYDGESHTSLVVIIVGRMHGLSMLPKTGIELMANRVSQIRKRYKERLDAGEIVLCALCSEPIPRKVTRPHQLTYGGKGGLTVDHIIERSKGGSNQVANLQPAHLKCNLEKSSHGKIRFRPRNLRKMWKYKQSQLSTT